MSCEGYSVLPLRTGYEQVISHRVGDGYCSQAQDDGIVESVSEQGIIVKYKNGQTKGFLLGRRFGKAAGQTIPHEMVTQFKVGDAFQKDDTIVYNNGWFEPDYFNKGQVLYKAGVIATVALVETPQTHEDACTITESFARKLKTSITKEKKVRINFKETVSDLVAIGQKVAFETPLIIIQDEMSSSIGAFSEDTIATLALLGATNAPTAKTSGVVESIDVYYNGSKEDMSISVRALANYGDKMIAKRAKQTNDTVYTGLVDESYRVEGEPLLKDTMCVVFHITEGLDAGIADKVVFANQMKSIISEVADYEMVSETGEQVDALFGAYSIFKRIVNSAFTIGTTNVLLEIGAKHALKLYKG